MSRSARPTGEVGPPGPWQSATVLEVRAETTSAKTFTLKLPDPCPHLPGQHYIVRLTAPNGYRAQRSYSVASAPGGDTIDLTVERLPGGEVSGFLYEVVMPGDKLDVRGPIGGYFAWDSKVPALGVAGGSGVVPLMAMLRAARRTGRPGLMRLVVSVRAPADLYYSGELPGPDTTIVYTRQAPAGFQRPPGRLTPPDLVPAISEGQVAYVCGSPRFCDSASFLLRDLDVPEDRIRVERFGPSG
ncbi:MAG TPA: FAD-binding oxidoreductase [Trebonia sp.]